MFKGAFADAFTVAAPAPLGRARPDRHERAGVYTGRDVAPAGTTDSPDAVTDVDDFASLPSGPATNPAMDRHGHDYRPGHNVDDDLGAPSSAENHTLVDHGGDHVTAPLLGAGGAAHGGLRGDSSAAWSNPEGFRTGTVYTPPNSTRLMGRFRMRGMFRGVRPQRIETGTNPSPPGRVGFHTSPFDPTAKRMGFGPARPIQRQTVPPHTETLDTLAGGMLDGGTVGNEYAL